MAQHINTVLAASLVCLSPLFADTKAVDRVFNHPAVKAAVRVRGLKKTPQDLLDHFWDTSLVSPEKRKLYRARHREIVSRMAPAMDGLTDTKKKGAYVLTYLHKHVFRRYSLLVSRAGPLFESGTFNCVSSAIYYNVVARHFGLTTSAMLVKEHTYSRLHLDGGTVRVETTNRYGFEPGKKKDRYNQYGKKIGVAYLPKLNYSKKRPIRTADLFALLLSNESLVNSQKKQYVDAVAVAYAATQINPRLVVFRNNLQSALSEYLNSLIEKDRYADGRALVDELPRRGVPRAMADRLGKMFYTNAILGLSKDRKYTRAVDTALAGMTRYPGEKKLRHNLTAALSHQMEDLIKRGKYDEGRELLKQVEARKVPASVREKTALQFFINAPTRLAGKQAYERAIALSVDGLKRFPKNKNIRRNTEIYHYSRAQSLAETGSFAEAYAVLRSLKTGLPKWTNIPAAAPGNNWRQVYLQTILRQTEQLRKAQRFDRAFSRVAEGLRRFPGDTKLVKTYGYLLDRAAKHKLKTQSAEETVKWLRAITLPKGIDDSHRNRAVFRIYRNTPIDWVKQHKYLRAAKLLESALKQPNYRAKLLPVYFFVLQEGTGYYFKRNKALTGLALLDRGAPRGRGEKRYLKLVEHYYNRLGLRFIKQKRYTQAVNIYRRGLKLHSASNLLNNNLKYAEGKAGGSSS